MHVMKRQQMMSVRISFRASIIFLSICAFLAAASFVFIGLWRHMYLTDISKTLVQAVLLLTGSVSVIVALLLCRYWLLKLAPDVGSIVFDKPGGKLDPEKWFNSNIGFFDFTLGNYLFGIFVGLVALTSYYMMPYIDSQDYLVLTFGYGAIFVCGFIAGTALYTLARGVRFLNQLGRHFEFHLSEHKFGVLLIGRVLIKCFSIIVITVAFFESTAFVGSGGERDVISNLYSPSMWFLGYPVAIFLFGSFVYAQHSMHQKLRHSKRTRIREIEERIRAIGFPDQANDGKKVDLLLFWHDELRRTLDMPEWPCSIRGFISGGAISVYGLVFPALTEMAFQTFVKVVSDAS